MKICLLFPNVACIFFLHVGIFPPKRGWPELLTIGLPISLDV